MLTTATIPESELSGSNFSATEKWRIGNARKQGRGEVDDEDEDEDEDEDDGDLNLRSDDLIQDIEGQRRKGRGK